MNLLIEEVISNEIQIDRSWEQHTTPVGVPYEHWKLKCKEEEMCCVTILRAGDSMLDPMFNILPNIKVGKILIQRNERTAEPVYYYEKLPENIDKLQKVFVLDPMLATGGSAACAIRRIIENGVNPENIIFINLLACERGISRIHKEFPQVEIVTACVDPVLNEKCYIVPGLGDYGDRYYSSKN